MITNRARNIYFLAKHLFSNDTIVRTAIVRCGQLGPDGTLVKPLQQVPMNGHLVVPLATLDNELQPVK